LRQVQFELASQAEKQPAQAIALANTLWKAGWLETRLLAAYLLGCVPPAQAIPSLTRLPEWLSLSTDKQVRAALLTDALSRLRKENLEALLQLLEGWLKSPRNAYQSWGLRALIPILTDPQFENLPAVFRILKPAIKSAGPVTGFLAGETHRSTSPIDAANHPAHPARIISQFAGRFAGNPPPAWQLEITVDS
jgi:hypothetical protein